MTKQVHAPGVLVSHELGADCFTGTAEDLVAAGLVRTEQLPGQPGNGTTTVSFRADGTRVRKGTPGACRAVGYLRIRKVSRLLICVEQGIGDEEHRRRRQAWFDALAREREEQRNLARSWPFPIVCGRPV
jgi:hypothetical protein